MNKLEQLPLGEIVAEDYRTAKVFRFHGLDFCCGGKNTLEKAVKAKNLCLETLIKELEEVKIVETEEHNYGEWSLDFLVDYIIQNHHGFVKRTLPEIEFYAEKVARVHGNHHPELVEIFKKVKQLSYELKGHLKKEESDLFPMIKDLVQYQKSEDLEEVLIEVLEDEHEKAGKLMADIETLSNNFTPPEDACTSYSVLFKNLSMFQKDLHKHVHLENNILFPRALRFSSLSKN